LRGSFVVGAKAKTGQAESSQAAARPKRAALLPAMIGPLLKLMAVPAMAQTVRASAADAAKIKLIKENKLKNKKKEIKKNLLNSTKDWTLCFKEKVQTLLRLYQKLLIRKLAIKSLNSFVCSQIL